MSETKNEALLPLVASENESDDRSGERSLLTLCLSGGGYRAMLFHLGTLLRLNDFGYLPKLDRISSVSGGSITAAALGMHWNKLKFDAAGKATNLVAEVIDPIRKMARVDVDVAAVAKGTLWFGSISDKVEAAYDEHLYQKATLQNLPDRPRFVINATNLESRALFRFSKPYIWDYRVGKIEKPEVTLAKAVAASSAFPPFLSPCTIDLRDATWVPGSGAELELPEFQGKIKLTDGGVYDNLGLETAWKSSATILVSDGGGATAAEADPDSDWGRQTKRVLDIIDSQVRALRKRMLIAAFERKEMAGAYWGIGVRIEKYGAKDKLPAPYAQTLDLAETPTRLAEVDDARQQRLINWGYAVCDAGMRSWVDPTLPVPTGFPYPGGV